MKYNFDGGIRPSRKRYIEFGKYMINYFKLENSQLLVKYKSNATIPEFPKTEDISQELAELLMTLINTKDVNYDMIRHISSEDKALFDRLIYKAGLKTQLNYDPQKVLESPEELITAFEILQGEINAGNNNVDILKRGKELIIKLQKIGKISKEQATEILNEINSII